MAKFSNFLSWPLKKGEGKKENPQKEKSARPQMGITQYTQ